MQDGYKQKTLKIKMIFNVNTRHIIHFICLYLWLSNVKPEFNYQIHFMFILKKYNHTITLKQILILFFYKTKFNNYKNA